MGHEHHHAPANYGRLAHSLALVADAGHNLSDVLVGVGCIAAVLVVNELAARTLQRERRGTRTSKRRQL
jgi:Co/Zn/Cd efflux system component